VVNRFKGFHDAGETEDERVQKMADNIASYAQLCMTGASPTPFQSAFSKTTKQKNFLLYPIYCQY
jgi:hypothetical protein